MQAKYFQLLDESTTFSAVFNFFFFFLISLNSKHTYEPRLIPPVDYIEKSIA